MSWLHCISLADNRITGFLPRHFHFLGEVLQSNDQKKSSFQRLLHFFKIILLFMRSYSESSAGKGAGTIIFSPVCSLSVTWSSAAIGLGKATRRFLKKWLRVAFLASVANATSPMAVSMVRGSIMPIFGLLGPFITPLCGNKDTYKKYSLL